MENKSKPDFKERHAAGGGLLEEGKNELQVMSFEIGSEQLP